METKFITVHDKVWFKSIVYGRLKGRCVGVRNDRGMIVCDIVITSKRYPKSAREMAIPHDSAFLSLRRKG
jgi:hypothetical protein